MSVLIGDIAEWVYAKKLKRYDIQEDCVDAATDFYRLLCARIPFAATQTTSAERSFTADVATYDLSDLDPVLSGIMSIRVTLGTNRYRRLRRSHVRVYDAMSSASSDPYSYARWGSGIEVNPAPRLSTYTYRVRYWSVPDFDTTELGDVVTVYPEEWAELHKWETLYRVLHNLDQYEKAMALITPTMMPRQISPKRTVVHEMGIIPKLWNDLLLTIAEREFVDEDFSINPLSRQYSGVRSG